MTSYNDQAYALGVEAAETAASWTYDGNSDREERARVLTMLRNGDPAAYDYLPREPNLSGQFAGDPTPRSLTEDIIGHDPEDDSMIDEIAEAFEDGVSETFSLACERALIAFCESEETEQ